MNSRWFWRIKGKDSIFLVHLELYFHFNVCSLTLSVFPFDFHSAYTFEAISGEMSGGRRRAAFYPHSWNFVSNLYAILSFDFSFLAVCEDGFDLGFRY